MLVNARWYNSVFDVLPRTRILSYMIVACHIWYATKTEICSNEMIITWWQPNCPPPPALKNHHLHANYAFL
jgi:hypothetical protein